MERKPRCEERQVSCQEAAKMSQDSLVGDQTTRILLSFPVVHRRRSVDGEREGVKGRMGEGVRVSPLSLTWGCHPYILANPRKKKKKNRGFEVPSMNSNSGHICRRGSDGSKVGREAGDRVENRGVLGETHHTLHFPTTVFTQVTRSQLSDFIQASS